jgi:CHRD domain
MKYVASLALVVSLATVAACGGADSPSSPSGNSTQTFAATLKPSEEVPAVTGPESAGSGTATITLNVSKDTSGNVTSATATFAVNLASFPAGTPINMAHIHQAPIGQSGDVVVNTTVAPGDVSLRDGAGSFNKSGIAVPADIANQLMTNPAAFYFNVHSTLNPSGVARGQLARVQ